MKRLFSVRATFLFLAAVAISGCSDQSSDDNGMRAQLTIYVAPPLLEKGGTVIVVSNSMPLDQWRDLPQGRNPARDDPHNEKKKDIRQGDRLFGAVASEKVSIIEFVYPEGGTFGFNLVPLPQPDGGGNAPAPALMTKRVLVGDGGYRDWKTGKEYLWESVSTIYVAGPEASEGDSRGTSFVEAEIMNLPPQKTTYEGTTVYTPTNEQLEQVLIKPHD